MSNNYLLRLRSETQAKIDGHQELLDARQAHLVSIKEIDEELANTDIEQARLDIQEIDQILNALEPKTEESESETEESCEEEAEEQE